MRGKFRKNYRQEPMEAMKVVVHNNDITKALRTLKRKCKMKVYLMNYEKELGSNREVKKDD